MSNEFLEDDILKDNEEIIEDIAHFDTSSIVVYSRDWTIETMYSQIMGKNINLNPKYQRRNAWTDEKRSKLIESIIIGYPVPEIVLAEDPVQKKSFAVIDGKQRLLTIAGFINPQEFGYWDNGGKLVKLSVKQKLNSLTFENLKDAKFSDELREFFNSALRCTIITNFQENDILYDIFYRLNSGSVSLSTQELRQVLNRGEFADYLIETTNEPQPLHNVMNLTEPDKRLRDIEVLLRCISMIEFSENYNGNLKQFLDNTMAEITKNWKETYEQKLKKLYIAINDSIEVLKTIFGDYNLVGRKFTNDKAEARFNRVVLEVQLFFFVRLDRSLINPVTIEKFRIGFINLCQEDKDFRSSIESTTKNIDNYTIRFRKFQELTNQSFGANLNINPFLI